jgi:hypothetical protein
MVRRTDTFGTIAKYLFLYVLLSLLFLLTTEQGNQNMAVLAFSLQF